MGAIKLEAGGQLAFMPQVRLLFTICKAARGPLAHDDVGSLAWIDGEDRKIREDSVLISIIIVNFNSGPLLTRCVSSCLSPLVDKVLVVDNASQDLSIKQCESVFVSEPRLEIIRNNENLGFAAACNIGLARSKSDYVLFLNPDCNLDEAAIPELLRVLQSDRWVGMVGGLLTNPDGSEQGGGRRAVPTPWRSFVRAFGLNRYADRWPRLFFDFHLNKQALPEYPIEVESISGACMMVKREVFDAVGIWDEGYFLHCEDLDLCMRLRHTGWKVLFVPSAIITHALGGCSKSRPIFVEWHKHRGMVRFYRKFFRHQYPGVLLWLVLLGVWLHFAMIAGYHLGSSGLLRLRGLNCVSA